MSGSQQTISCPKCGSEMRSYERNGITVDQCIGCRGVFLDRGELERLIDAEGSYYERERPRQEERHHEERGREHRPKSKRKSFLENILEMGGD